MESEQQSSLARIHALREGPTLREFRVNGVRIYECDGCGKRVLEVTDEFVDKHRRCGKVNWEYMWDRQCGDE